METKSKNLTKDEIEQVIDSYFDKLGNQIVGLMKESFPIKALVLKTADDQNLEFPEDIQESSQIEVGTEGVKLDGKLADGKFTMPDGVILRIEKGVVKEMRQPTPEQIAARMRENVNKIRKDMADFKSQMKAYIVRTPFKAKAKVTTSSASRVPFRKSGV